MKIGIATLPLVSRSRNTPHPGACLCVGCIEPIELPNSQQSERQKMVLTEKQTQGAAGVPGILSFGKLATMAKTSPFPDHRPDSDFGDAGRGPGMPMKSPREAAAADDSDLAECCRTGTMEHLSKARDAIDREMKRRAGVDKVLRFAK